MTQGPAPSPFRKPRRRKLLPAWALLACVAALGISGCASTIKPVETGRQGLLDRLEGKGWASRSIARATGERREQSSLDERAPGASEPMVAAEKGLLRWPLEKVTVTSRFGRRNDGFHEGIDLRAPQGTPVYSAASGVVLYSDKRIRGYGRMVVIRHSGGITTVYAHNSKLLVRKGQKVKKGQKIAISGSSGRSSGPHLHFEVRSGVAAVNPERMLPDPKDVKTVKVKAPRALPKAKPRQVALGNDR